MDFVQLAPFHYRRVPTQMATDIWKNHWIFGTSPRFARKSDLTALRAPRWCPKCPVSWLLVTPSAPSDGRNTLWCLAGSTGWSPGRPSTWDILGWSEIDISWLIQSLEALELGWSRATLYLFVVFLIVFGIHESLWLKLCRWNICPFCAFIFILVKFSRDIQSHLIWVNHV